VTRLMNVLLVDDSSSFRKLARELIAALPWVGGVACAESGAQALDIVRGARFDLVLTDIAMPDMSGFAMIRHLRALDDPPQVVAVTLHEGAEYRAAVLRSGAEAMITKRKFAMEVPALIAAMGMGCTASA